MFNRRICLIFLIKKTYLLVIKKILFYDNYLLYNIFTANDSAIVCSLWYVKKQEFILKKDIILPSSDIDNGVKVVKLNSEN